MGFNREDAKHAKKIDENFACLVAPDPALSGVALDF
jgi:hypothetical protein